jgi:hypothetical protein
MAASVKSSFTEPAFAVTGQPLLELVQGQPPLAGGRAQPLGDALAVRVGHADGGRLGHQVSAHRPPP